MNDLKFVEIYGERLAYREAGCGEVVVLLHGMAGSSQTWRPIIPQLAKRHRVIAPDLLGHGDSAKPRTDYSLGAFAAGLRDLLDELGEAVTEITNAAKEMRIDASELGRALVGLAGGKGTSPYSQPVADRWRHLLALRGLEKSGNPTGTRRPLRVRYGPENQSVIC